jgi:hypothetical protein
MAFYGWMDSLAQLANSGTATLTLAGSSSWPWLIGDYVILLGLDDLTYDVQAVTNVAGGVLSLAGNLSYTWLENSVCWPVLFGKFTGAKFNLRSPVLESVEITIKELVSSRSVQLGITPAPAAGVGTQQIGETDIVT